MIESGEARASYKSLAVAHAGGRRWLTVGLGGREGLTPERATGSGIGRRRSRA